MRARCSGRMVCIDMTIEPVGGGTKSFGLCSESYQTKKGAASIATFVLATDFVTGVGLAVIKLRLNSDQVLRSVPLTLDGRRSVGLMYCWSNVDTRSFGLCSESHRNFATGVVLAAIW